MSDNLLGVVNPGSINVAAQGFGSGVPANQDITTGIASVANPNITAEGNALQPGDGIAVDENVTTGIASSANANITAEGNTLVPGDGVAVDQDVTKGQSSNPGPNVIGNQILEGDNVMVDGDITVVRPATVPLGPISNPGAANQ